MLEQIAVLERRLHDGWEICESAKAKEPDNVDRYDDFWLGLLAEYEELVQRSRGLT